MALLLEEANKLSQDQFRAGVIEVFVENSPLLRRLDLLNIRGSAYEYNLEGELPNVAFRGVNESFTESTGVINPQKESLKIAGGDLDVDKFIIETRGVRVRAAHEALKLKALSRTLNKYIMDGDETADPREFDGLNRRLTGSQKILAAAGGGPLTTDLMHTLLEATPDANALLVGSGGKSLLRKLAENSNQITHDVDQFGFTVERFSGVEVISMGKDAQNDEILAFDEDPGDAVFDTASIYALRLGDAEAETDFFGLQSESGMMVRDLGELDDKPVWRTRVEWYFSVVLGSADCAARLYGITNAVA